MKDKSNKKAPKKSQVICACGGFPMRGYICGHVIGIGTKSPKCGLKNGTWEDGDVCEFYGKEKSKR